MSWLRKRTDSRRAPPGLEWELLKNMPRIFVIGNLVPVLAAGLARLWPHSGSPEAIAAQLHMVDIYAFSAVVLHWTLVLTVSLGCFIVMVMKGPVYEADSYPLPDADRPYPGPRR